MERYPGLRYAEENSGYKEIPKGLYSNKRGYRGSGNTYYRSRYNPSTLERMSNTNL